MASLIDYKAHNEPILAYAKDSKELTELKAKLKEYEGKVADVPIVIGDEEIRVGVVKHQVMPFDHKANLAKYYYADVEVIRKAVDVSQKVRPSWEITPLADRAQIFLRAADLISGKYRMDLLAATMLGQGKTIIQAEIDAACELADFFRFNVQYALELQHWQPLSHETCQNTILYRGLEGFWAAIAPFNFTAISGHLASGPAFMGNVVLWKPSDTCVLSSYLVFKILREAGLPSGVISFLPADGPLFGDTIIHSPHLAGINFTGSAKTFQHIWSEVGKNVQVYRNFPRLIGECGGKNFHFVHRSANVHNVVNGTIRSAFEYSGQKCSACSRLYVPSTLWPQIRDGLLAAQSEMKVGSPLDNDTFFSAVIDDRAFDRIKSYLDYAKSSPDLKILAGGGCDNSKGYFIEPTIIQTTNPKEKVMEEEIFGPVLSVFVYEDDKYKEVLNLIDTTSTYGLTGSVYASDPQVLTEASEALRYAAGNFYVNDKSTGSVVGQQPFGGSRKSGTNDKAGGLHYLLKFVTPRVVKTTEQPMGDWRYSYMSA